MKKEKQSNAFSIALLVSVISLAFISGKILLMENPAFFHIFKGELLYGVNTNSIQGNAMGQMMGNYGQEKKSDTSLITSPPTAQSTNTTQIEAPSALENGAEESENQNEDKEEEKPACVYVYSSWSVCSPQGVQTRKVITKEPEDCVEEKKPEVTKKCTYKEEISSSSQTGTISQNQNQGSQSQSNQSQSNQNQGNQSQENIPQCGYLYSDWGECGTNKKQYRTVLSKTPSVCKEYETPVLNRKCDDDTENDVEIESFSENTIQTNQNNQNENSNKEGNVSVQEKDGKFSFVGLKNNIAISGPYEIASNAQGASKVEYYLEQFPSGMNYYLGGAYLSMSGYWVYGFDSSRFPNGKFSLYAKVEGSSGAYTSEKITVSIDNAIPEPKVVELKTDTKNTITSLENTLNGITSENWQMSHFGSSSCTNQNNCSFDADPDRDGLKNADEFRVGTDPNNPDTDKDGFLDGDEIKNGFNPLKSSPGDKRDKITFQSPKVEGSVREDVYQVSIVESVVDETGSNALRIQGKGLPSSFVTLYVFSEIPVVLTVETDRDGNWSYMLDKDLEDGEHQVYVAVTDNLGKITAKSNPLVFVKTAQAVEIIPDVSMEKIESPSKSRFFEDTVFLFVLIFTGIFLAVLGIGFFHMRNIRNYRRD